MRFQRLRYPQDYDRLAGSLPASLDSFAQLDANARLADVGDVGRFAQGSRVRSWGWALSLGRNGLEAPEAVMIAIGTTGIRFEARVGFERDDVARDFNDRGLFYCGFRGVHALDAPLGRHELSLIVVAANYGYHEKPLHRSIEIVPSSEQFPSVPKSEQTKIVSISLEAMHAPIGKGSSRFRLGDIVVARGEAFARETRTAPSQIFAIVDEHAYHPGVAGITSPSGERIGYSARIPTTNLKRGKHTLQIAAVATDGASYTLGPATSFVLRSA